MMPSDDEFQRRQRRTAWWLGVARKSRGRTQDDVARYLGLKAGSSVGDFERAVTFPSLKQLALLAALYEVPLSLFTEPPATDEERFLELATGAVALEREDWEQAQGEPPAAADAPRARRRRAS